MRRERKSGQTQVWAICKGRDELGGRGKNWGAAEDTAAFRLIPSQRCMARARDGLASCIWVAKCLFSTHPLSVFCFLLSAAQGKGFLGCRFKPRTLLQANCVHSSSCLSSRMHACSVYKTPTSRRSREGLNRILNETQGHQRPSAWH